MVPSSLSFSVTGILNKEWNVCHWRSEGVIFQMKGLYLFAIAGSWSGREHVWDCSLGPWSLSFRDLLIVEWTGLRGSPISVRPATWHWGSARTLRRLSIVAAPVSARNGCVEYFWFHGCIWDRFPRLGGCNMGCEGGGPGCTQLYPTCWKVSRVILLTLSRLRTLDKTSFVQISEALVTDTANCYLLCFACFHRFGKFLLQG